MSEKKSQIKPRLPPLNTLRAFEAAARHLSFVGAAEELCVTHGAVSRQIKALESSLDVALFERRNRAVFLTAQGTMLLATCTQVMGQLSDVLRQIQAPTASLPLVLSCEPTIAIRWLVPRLADFRARFPAFQIHLLTAGGQVNFERDRIDVALRRNDFQWGAQAFAESVAPEMVGPVCTPGMSSARSTAHILTSARLLHSKTRPHAWAQWAKLTQTALVATASEEYEHFYLSLQAAGAGLGVAMGSAYMVEDDLNDQRLTAPCGFVPDGSEYVLLSPVSFETDERRMVFLDWLRHAMGQTRASVTLDWPA